MVGKSQKIKISKYVREYFSQVGKVRNSIFSLSLSLRWDGGMGFPALAPNGYGGGRYVGPRTAQLP